MLSGADVETAFTYMASLKPLALGWNCGGDLKDAAVISQAFCDIAAEVPAGSLGFWPILVQPNAGAPVVEAAGKVAYPVGPEEFAQAQKAHFRMGARLLGGCCGTRPEHIRALRNLVEGEAFSQREEKNSSRKLWICTGVAGLKIGEEPLLVGERINPSNRPKIQEMLKNEDYESLADEAEEQAEAGAKILDINVGLGSIDQKAAMAGTIGAVQTVSMRTPLMIDSTDPVVIEEALRRYNGKAIINSVNGSRKSLDAILPLAGKYGAALVCLCFDEKGMKQTAEEKAGIAGRIMSEAAKYGIPRSDLLIDTLCMPAAVLGMDEDTKAFNSLEALRGLSLVKQRYPVVKTILGVSNVSFGLPKREILNGAFLAMAFYAGLDLAIVNPLQEEVQRALRCYRLLSGLDKDCLDYISGAS
jgi:5-methyltetrahydrofolate--homocysteine methyltransferase